MNILQSTITALVLGVTGTTGLIELDANGLIEETKAVAQIASESVISQNVDRYVLLTNDFSILNLEKSEQLLVLQNAGLIQK